MVKLSFPVTVPVAFVVVVSATPLIYIVNDVPFHTAAICVHVFTGIDDVLIACFQDAATPSPPVQTSAYTLLA